MEERGEEYGSPAWTMASSSNLVFLEAPVTHIWKSADPGLGMEEIN